MENHAKMDFFEVLIFNNVKSDLKIILFLPNQVVFKVKSVIFVKSIPIPKAPMGRGWADIYTFKANKVNKSYFQTSNVY